MITHNNSTHNSAERKCGSGGTDRAVSVARACKWWDFKSPVVWSRRIKHFCAPLPVPNKTGKFGVGGGTYPQSQGSGSGLEYVPPIFHVVASIANPMLSSSRKANKQ